MLNSLALFFDKKRKGKVMNSKSKTGLLSGGPIIKSSDYYIEVDKTENDKVKIRFFKKNSQCLPKDLEALVILGNVALELIR